MSEERPEMSVILCAYNPPGPKEIFLAIKSILKQTFRDFEFIIYDDGSDAEIAAAADKIKGLDPRIRTIKGEENHGLAFSLNTCIALSKGRYIARMDADDISLPERLELQLDFLIRNNLDLIGGLVQIMDEKGNDMYMVSRTPSSPEKVRRLSRLGDCLAHPTWLGKREVFVTLDGYRDLPCAADYDLQLRALMKGYRLSNLQAPVLRYRRTSSGISQRNLYRQYLTMCVLAEMYRSNTELSVEEILSRVDDRYSEPVAARYTKAETCFFKALSDASDRNIPAFLFNAVQIPFLSLRYCDKAIRFLLLFLFS